MTETPKRKNDERRRIHPLIMIIAIVLATGGLATLYVSLKEVSTQPPLYPLPGTLYYQAEFGMYARNMTTGERLRIDTNPLPDKWEQQSLSPDGRWKTSWDFNDDGSRYDLFLNNRQDEKQPPRLLGSFHVYTTALSWSADSEWIAIKGHVTSLDMFLNKPRVLLVQRETGEVKELLSDDKLEQMVFAPVGNKLAYATEESLWVVDISTGFKTQVLSLHMQQPITWSPDGAWLAYTTSPSDPHSLGDMRHSPTNLWVIRPDGTDAHEILKMDHGFQIMGWTDS